MTAAEILRDLERDGVDVTAEGVNLKVRSLRSPLTEFQKRLITDNKAALLVRLTAPVAQPMEAPAAIVAGESTEAIYREYAYPSGEILKLTREEFDNVVEVFRMLVAQDILLRERDTARLNQQEKGIFEPDRTPPHGGDLVE